MKQARAPLATKENTMLSGVMGMMTGPMDMLNQVMQTVQQMQQKQGGECGESSQGGQNDPALMFQQLLQQLTQGQG